MMNRHKKQAKKTAAKAAQDTAKIDWQATDDVIRCRKELAIEAGEVGVFAYWSGIVSGALLGDALSMQLETPEQAVNVVRAIIDGKQLDDDELDEVVRRVFFRLGVYRGFLARTEGRIKKGRLASDE